MEVNEVPLLVRREIEARILQAFLEELAQEVDRELLLAALRRTIQRLAYEAGRELARRMGGNDMVHMARVVREVWQAQNALDVEFERVEPQRLVFKVTRCAFVEMYERLGMRELGYILSCARDAAFIQGFNPQARLERTQTLMEGAPYCDFCFYMQKD